MNICDHCGFDAALGHDCAESRPNPALVERLREDHRDTIECEHGFMLHESPCPNRVCLARDLAAAALEIERLRAIVPIGPESYEEAVDRYMNRSNGYAQPTDAAGVPIPNSGKGGRFWLEGELEIDELEALVVIGKHRLNNGETG